MSRVVILGGGVSPLPHYNWIPSNIWVGVGLMKPSQVTFPVKAVWRRSDSDRRRKYYRLTDRGKEELASQRSQWQVVDATLRRTLFLSLQLVPQGG